MSRINIYSVLLNFFQLLTYFPFIYDATKKRFKKSRFLQMYSIVILTVIGSTLHYIFYTWFNALNLSKPSVDALYVTGMWTTNLIPLYILLYQTIFKIDSIVELANEMLDLFEIFNRNDRLFKNRLIWQIIIEFLLAPMAHLSFGLMFLKFFYPKPYTSTFTFLFANLFIYLFLSFIFPFSIIIQYYAGHYKFLNNRLIKVISDISSTKDFSKIKKIDNIFDSYVKLQTLIPKITQIFTTTICLLFVITITSLTWTIYTTTICIFLKVDLKIIAIAIGQVAIVALYCLKNVIPIIIASQSIKNQSVIAVLTISDINNKLGCRMPTALRQKV